MVSPRDWIMVGLRIRRAPHATCHIWIDEDLFLFSNRAFRPTCRNPCSFAQKDDFAPWKPAVSWTLLSRQHIWLLWVFCCHSRGRHRSYLPLKNGPVPHKREQRQDSECHNVCPKNVPIKGDSKKESGATDQIFRSINMLPRLFYFPWGAHTVNKCLKEF